MLASTGMNQEQTGTVTQVLFNLMNMFSTQIAPPGPSTAAPSTQPPDHGPVLVADDKEPELHAENEPLPMEGDFDLTDGSTDTEAEAKAANANEPHTKIRKKTSRRARDAEHGKGGQGKGSATDIIKVADKVKGKKKN